MQALLEVVLPVFLILGSGYAAVRLGVFAEAGADALMTFTQRFAIPCLLFRAIATLDIATIFDWRLLASFYAGALASFVVALLGARWLFARAWPDSVAIGFVALFSNSVLLGLPITERAFGADALGSNYAIIAFHAPFCYGVGLVAMELVRNRAGGLGRTAGAILRAMLGNAMVMAIVLGLAANVWGGTLPDAIARAIDMMVQAALPAALFGLGGVLVRYRPEGDLSAIAFVVAVSLVLHPAVTWVLGRALALDQAAFRSAVVTAAMAPGVNTFVFANMYGVAKRIAASSVLLGTAVCVVSAWTWLSALI